MSLESIMKSNCSNFFGIKIEEKIVCGLIPEGAEAELASQLLLLQDVFTGLSVLDFYKNAIENIKEDDWYAQAIERLDRHGGRAMLSSGGEQDGIMLLLHLSRVCILIAKASGEGDTASDTCRKRGMIKTALSIILPIVGIPLSICVPNTIVYIGVNSISFVYLPNLTT